MAGVRGFEPRNAGIRIRCLTAWRYPNCLLRLTVTTPVEGNSAFTAERLLNLAGVRGFEPRNAGIRIRCLTAWRYPNTVAVNRKYRRNMAGVPGFEPGNAGIKNRCLTAWRYPIRTTLTGEWCGRRDLNSHTLRRQNLNLVRLPISPLPQKRWWLRRDSNL